MSLLVLSRRYGPVYSGAAAQEHRVWRALAAQGLSVEVLTLGWPGLGTRESIDSISIRRTGSASRWGRLRYTLACVRKVVAGPRRQRVVLAMSGGWGPWLGIWLAGRLGSRTLWRISLDGSDDPLSIERQQLGWLKLRLVRSAGCVICLTPALVERCLAAGLPREHCHLVPNAVDVETFRPADAEHKARVRERLSIPAAWPVAVFAGALNERKRILELLQSWEELGVEMPESLLLLCGPSTKEEAPSVDEAYVAGIRSRCEGDGLRGRVRLTGRLDEESLRAHFRAADVYVSMSRAEGLPNAVLEAMAAGLPVVTVAAPGGLEGVIEDGRQGCLVTPGSEASLGAKLCALLGDPGRVRRMGGQARLHMENHFSLGAKIETYRALMTKLGAFGAGRP